MGHKKQGVNVVQFTKDKIKIIKYLKSDKLVLI